jgi:iron(III) transport system substrate-binding protein
MKSSSWLFAALTVLVASCGKSPDLVVYVSHDQEFAEPLIRQFEQETGLKVDARFDIEANKTVGLVRAIREEAGHPRCDVFWNNEAGHSVALANDGLLTAYESPSAKDIPAQFRDPQHRWTGFGARARIFIVNTDLADPKTITSMWDLVDPKWSGKAAIARPLTGTTLTHMAALYAALGDAKAEEYVTKIRELGKTGQVNLASGNALVARLVGDGEVAFGWTDTDDFAVTLERGKPVAAVYPDADTIGTLFVPNTIMLVKGAPHPDAAKRFIDWVLKPETERALAFSRSAQIPVRANVERPKTTVAPGAFKAMEVDFQRVGERLEQCGERMKVLFVQ